MDKINKMIMYEASVLKQVLFIELVTDVTDLSLE